MQDNMSRQDDPNDYVVHDPLLEKGKEKFNKMQAKLKRQQREWAGKSLTWLNIFADFASAGEYLKGYKWNWWAGSHTSLS